MRCRSAVHEQSQRHRGEDGDLGLAAGDVGGDCLFYADVARLEDERAGNPEPGCSSVTRSSCTSGPTARGPLTQLVSLNSQAAGSQGQRSVLPSRGEARPRRRTASSKRLCRHRLQHPPTRLRAPGPAPDFTPYPRRSGRRAQIDKMAAGPTYSAGGRRGAREVVKVPGRAHRAPNATCGSRSPPYCA
jgi:hypothetical protein